MKERNLSYEEKFRKYLFSFDLDKHKEICENINVKPNITKDVEDLTDEELKQEFFIFKREMEVRGFNLENE